MVSLTTRIWIYRPHTSQSASNTKEPCAQFLYEEMREEDLSKLFIAAKGNARYMKVNEVETPQRTSVRNDF